MIDVFVCEVGNKQYYKTIENTLETMQTLVGGYIEIVRIPSLAPYGIVLAVDEEARFKQKERSLWIDTTWILGTCFFVKEGTDGNFTQLNEEDKQQLAIYMSGEAAV